jgi:hypothetical protein
VSAGVSPPQTTSAAAGFEILGSGRRIVALSAGLRYDLQKRGQNAQRKPMARR